MVIAGECVSEAWRTLVCSRLGSDTPELDSAALYGTADGGVLAVETPLSIRIRRVLAQDAGLAQRILGQARLPTLLQYDPCERYFEEQDGELLFTADGGVPLARWRILDRGGILPFAAMLARLRSEGVDLAALTPPGMVVRDLPFVWVHGRTHVALSLDGANIYPEHIAGALERTPLCEELSGKFVMRIVHDADHNPCLHCVLELLPGASASSRLAEASSAGIRAELERVNSEYAHYVPEARRPPLVELRPHRDPEFFPAGTKHRYVR